MQNSELKTQLRPHKPAAIWRARKRVSALRPPRSFATVTTDASCGAVNNMHDSLTPLGGLVPLFNIQTGEVIFGGVGAGLYGILLYAILAVFIAGLMVGRTPEYVGKKIEQKEVKMAMLALIATAFSILVLAGISTVVKFPGANQRRQGSNRGAKLLERGRTGHLQTSTTTGRTALLRNSMLIQAR